MPRLADWQTASRPCTPFDGLHDPAGHAASPYAAATTREWSPMTDRSAFSAEEWKALAEAPLQITIALVAVGPHRPITMVKEAAASARELARPGDRGAANQLIAEIGKGANSHEARHDVEVHRSQSPEQIAEGAIAGVEAAVIALAKLSGEEATEVRQWYGEIAKAVADASKAITPGEQAVLDRLNEVLEASPG